MRTKDQEIDLAENKTAYLKKMERQLKDVEKRVKELEKIASDRNAEDNSMVRSAFEKVNQQLNEARQKFEDLEVEFPETWPERSRDVSFAYRHLEDLIGSLGAQIKPK